MQRTINEAFVAFSKTNIVHSFLGKEANGKVFPRNRRDMRIKTANDTATDDI